MINAITAAIRRGLWPTANEVRAWYGLPQVGKPNPRYDYVPGANNGPACVPTSARVHPRLARAALQQGKERTEGITPATVILAPVRATDCALANFFSDLRKHKTP